MNKTRVYFLLESFRLLVHGKRYDTALTYTAEWVPTDFGTKRRYCTYTLNVSNKTSGALECSLTYGEDDDDRDLREKLEELRRRLLPLSPAQCWECRHYFMNWPERGACCNPNACQHVAMRLTTPACKQFETIAGHARAERGNCE